MEIVSNADSTDRGNRFFLRGSEVPSIIITRATAAASDDIFLIENVKTTAASSISVGTCTNCTLVVNGWTSTGSISVSAVNTYRSQFSLQTIRSSALSITTSSESSNVLTTLSDAVVGGAATIYLGQSVANLNATVSDVTATGDLVVRGVGGGRYIFFTH